MPPRVGVTLRMRGDSVRAEVTERSADSCNEGKRNSKKIITANSAAMETNNVNHVHRLCVKYSAHNDV